VTPEPRLWCPGCEPKADQFDDLLDIQYCGNHAPERVGADDSRTSCEFGTPSDAEINRAFCALIHGTRP